MAPVESFAVTVQTSVPAVAAGVTRLKDNANVCCPPAGSVTAIPDTAGALPAGVTVAYVLDRAPVSVTVVVALAALFCSDVKEMFDNFPSLLIPATCCPSASLIRIPALLN